MKELLINELNKLDNIIHKDYLIKYVEFCLEKNQHHHIVGETELHHILPKSKNLPFVKYKNLNENKWNGVYLKYADHYVAHSILAKAVNNDYISYAWHAMNSVNKNDILNISPQMYEELRRKHSDMMRNKAKERNKCPELIQKRLNTMNKVQENGLTKFEEQGKKISNSLKNKVYSYNLKEDCFEHVSYEIYNSRWYLVGRTAKYITFFKINNEYYTSLDILCEVHNLDINYYKSLPPRTKRPYTRVKLSIDSIQEEFHYYDSRISNNS